MNLLRRLFRRAKPALVSRPLPCYLRRHFEAQDTGRFDLPAQPFDGLLKISLQHLTPSSHEKATQS